MSIRTRIVKVAAVVTLSGESWESGPAPPWPPTAIPASGARQLPSGKPSELHKRTNMEYEGELTRKVNEYEGQHLTADENQSLSRRVSEYEGQHRQVGPRPRFDHS